MKKKRISKIRRKTRETDIELLLNLDGSGKSEIKTNIGFLDHMLTLFSYHGLFDLKVKVRKQDLDVDIHHTNEDVGICLGEAVKKALGSKAGITRFGFASIPMDEALVRITIDISSRSSLYAFESMKAVALLANEGKEAAYSYEHAKQFLQAFCSAAGINMHIEIVLGEDLHHVIEALFKAFGRTLKQATAIDPRRRGVPSTKGKL